MKLCWDCKHCQWGTATHYSRCRRSLELDLVDGAHTPEVCYYVRAPYGKCGPEGKLYEPGLMIKLKEAIRNGLRRLGY